MIEILQQHRTLMGRQAAQGLLSKVDATLPGANVVEHLVALR